MYISDAAETGYVYDWRLQQEAALRATRGTGMTDEQVVDFVNGCEFFMLFLIYSTTNYHPDYPAYELYTEVLRKGLYPQQQGKQLRLVVDKSRKVKDVYKL